jgi:hypothetical protein
MGTDTGEEWLQHRLLELYHRSMDHIIQDINDLCSRDHIYLRFADDRVCCVSTFFYALGMDGAEVAAALLCIIFFFLASVFHILATNGVFWPDSLSFWPASTFCFPTEPARYGILILTNSAEIQCH